MKRERVLTTKELADYMKLNEKTILKMAQKGEIPGVKVGSRWRFHLEAIDPYLQKDIMETPEDELDNIIRTTNQIIPLSRLFDAALIDLDIPATGKKGVLSSLVELGYRGGIVEKKELLLQQLESREKMLSTAVGKGVAIPHPRDPRPDIFKKPNIVLVRSKKGVNFSAPDGEKVHLFFMTCAPNMVVHLRLLAKISRLLHVKGTAEKLMKASDKEEVMRMLMEMDREHLFPWSNGK
ncbi:MAG: PTS sugar transporter subunit IIA [Candidatus Omnitrophota bacterium]|nr:PTS sugar transporter subunit IIA [Candidatus Omnitrophota bacterium]